MSVIDNLITDRTAADAALVKQLAAIGYDQMTTAQRNQWNTDLKGAYNASDLNRVGEAINYLVAALNDGYNTVDTYRSSMGVAPDVMWTPEYWEPNWHILEITGKTNWGTASIPTSESLAEYLANVYEATACIYITPPIPLPNRFDNLSNLTYEGANAIEMWIQAEYNTVGLFLDFIYEKLLATRKAGYYSGDLFGGEI